MFHGQSNGQMEASSMQFGSQTRLPQMHGVLQSTLHELRVSPHVQGSQTISPHVQKVPLQSFGQLDEFSQLGSQT